MKIQRFALYAIALIILIFISSCANQGNQPDNKTPVQPVDRESKIPASAVKITMDTDDTKPIMNSNEYNNPVMVAYPINTAGAEDSPFIPVDSNDLYFFFTPDVSLPPEKQLFDGVTGIYVSKKQGSTWQKPERIMLQDQKKLALDGCAFIENNIMYFCSAREGYTGINWFKADYSGAWKNWKLAGIDQSTGELHYNNGKLYYGSQGDLYVDGVKINEVSSIADESQPFVTKDGSELWFTRTYQGTPAVFRSKNVGGKFQEPELIISQFAGEPTLDSEGNIFFVHHYFKNGKMIEADIYIATKK